MTDSRQPVRSVIANGYSLFYGTHALHFAELLIEHLEDHGWTIVAKAEDDQTNAE